VEDYLRPLNISICGYSADGDEVVLGMIGADQLLFGDCIYDNQHLISVCDADSSGMVELFEALFDEEYKFQPELEVEETTEYVLFVWKGVFHPKLRPYQSTILESLSRMMGLFCAMVMRRAACELSDKELANLRFQKIAGTDFVFKHTSFECEFSRENPIGSLIQEFEVEPNDAHWVQAEWKKD